MEANILKSSFIIISSAVKNKRYPESFAFVYGMKSDSVVSRIFNKQLAGEMHKERALHVGKLKFLRSS